MEITCETARRFLLAKQGLWPAPFNLPLPPDYNPLTATLRTVEMLGIVQVDTISVVARNHDLVLFSRVPGYRPEHLDHWLYGPERRLFESLYPLYIQPLTDYRLLRQPGREPSVKARQWEAEQAELIALVLSEIERRGPLSSRNFENRPIVEGGWNVVKDVTNALWHLWYYDRLLTAYRRSAVRYYDLSERVLPDWVDIRAVEPAEAKRYWAVRTLKVLNLASAAQWSARFKFFYNWNALSNKERQTLLQELQDFTTFSRVRISGLKEDYYLLTKDLPLLEQVAAMPDATSPLGVSFIAPLDSLMWDRRRIEELFDFEYLWEVYVPATKRRWGYYVLPILYGSQLIGRLDAKAERKGGRLLVHNLTLELAHQRLAADAIFQHALAQALHRFMRFNGATHLQISSSTPAMLGDRVGRLVEEID
ncbi:MAG: hypothetical protein DLM69_04480 [Candidatus Chloroheliales bacterium]|nr:MAG: hypothetical protein DLM69_04480 [Chloroflexota bacterium]